MSKVKQAYRFALDPTLAQERALRSHAGAARFAWNTVRRMLAYKTAWNCGTLVTADRWYPSSKTCSGCGAVKAKLGLSERTYHCGACGLILDRDVNAARNLLKLAASGAESLNARRETVSPRVSRHVSPKREPGTRKRDETGTVPAQAGTAG